MSSVYLMRKKAFLEKCYSNEYQSNIWAIISMPIKASGKIKAKAFADCVISGAVEPVDAVRDFRSGICKLLQASQPLYTVE